MFYSVLKKSLRFIQSSSAPVWPPRYEEKIITPKRHQLEFWDTQLKVWERQAIIFSYVQYNLFQDATSPAAKYVGILRVDFISTSAQFSLHLSLNCITKHIINLCKHQNKTALFSKGLFLFMRFLNDSYKLSDKITIRVCK